MTYDLLGLPRCGVPSRFVLMYHSFSIRGLGQGSNFQAMLEFRSLTGMILLRYYVDVSMHGVSDRLEIEGGTR